MKPNEVIGAYVIDKLNLIKVFNPFLKKDIPQRMIHFLGYGVYRGEVNYKNILEIKDKLIVVEKYDIKYSSPDFVAKWMNHYLEQGWATQMNIEELIKGDFTSPMQRLLKEISDKHGSITKETNQILSRYISL